MTSADFLYPHLKICIHIFVSVHAFHMLRFLVLLLPYLVLSPNCLGFLGGSHGTVGDFSSPSHFIGTTGGWKQISSFSKIICLRSQSYSLSTCTTENTSQSTLLTEQSHWLQTAKRISVLSAFAKWLNCKSNQLKQCVFVSSFWNLLHYK